MKIFSGLGEKNNLSKEAIISIGVFDAFHIGHEKLIKNMVAKAEALDLESFVLTFRIPPRKDNKLPILELNDKLSYIEKLGVKNVILCDFNEDFSAVSSIDFLRILEKNFNIMHYYIGDDFRFGFNKSGSKEMIQQMGYTTYIEKTLEIDDKKVSTSEIKKYIKNGDVEKIIPMLGRAYQIKGVVKMGKQLGRTLGYPTMNMINPQIMYPANGAYITMTMVNGCSYQSMTFVDSSIIESHLIGFEKFEYNFPIKVDFFKKIRDNKDFSGLDELVAQLEKDLTLTKQYFNTYNMRSHKC